MAEAATAVRVDRSFGVAKVVGCASVTLYAMSSTEKYYASQNRQAFPGLLLSISCLDSFKMFGTSWGTPQLLSHVHVS